MAFTINMAASARRHLEAANLLNGGPRRDVAGYLYGIAAECAVKAMMRDAGFSEKSIDNRRADPYFAHFPELRTMIRDARGSRISATLMKLIRDDSFMNSWSTTMRYSASDQIQNRWVDQWAEHAKRAVGLIGT